MKNPDYYYDGEPRYIPHELKAGLPHDWSYLKVQGEIAALQTQVAELNKRSGLMSKSWINRVFTTWGYFLIAQVMIGLVVLVLGMIFGLLN